MPDKFELECALVTRLLEALGLPGVPSDPKKTYGRETGADVEVRLAARRIGVQVTEYHGDEGQGGSALRAQEESDAAKSIIRAYAVPTDASCGLTKRFSDKLAKASRHTFDEFAEVWLLIAAFLPKLGAVAATSAVPIFITTEWLEQHFGEALRASTYQRAFFHVHLWPALYEWSLEGGWKVIREPEKLTADGADRSGINSTTPGDARQRGGYVLKTGKPRWSVGCIQTGPKHDAGLRWFVCERGPGGDLHEVAYTEEREEAEMIVASLERTEGD